MIERNDMTARIHDRLAALLRHPYAIDRDLTDGRLSRVFLAEETRFKRKRITRLEHSNRGERQAHG